MPRSRNNNAKPLLSVIMPVYNEGEHIAFALESLLMQQTDFSYEILVVDDCSTDDTAAIVQSYHQSYPHIHYHKNLENKGNAYSFWRGLTESRGEFFQVLDGDDFLIRRDKLQRQVDFLKNNPGYAAVAANSLRILKNGHFYPETQPLQGDRDYTYQDALQFIMYFHTSSYMYRNLYKDNVPEFLKEDWARGDGIRTIIHAKHGKIRFLDFIGSVYRYNDQGIWSLLTPAQRNQRAVHAFKNISEKVLQTRKEKDILAQTIKFYESYRGKSKVMILLLMFRSPKRLLKKIFDKGSLHKLKRFLFAKPVTHAPAAALQDLHTRLSRISYSHKTKAQVFAHCYTARYADQLCESLGKLYLDDQKHLSRQTTFNSQSVVFLVSGLQKKSGGIFRELCDLIEIHLSHGQSITILSSERVETPADVIAHLATLGNVVYDQYPQTSDNYHAKMAWLVDRLIALKPGRLYPFPSHDDVALNAAVQTGLAQEIVIDFCFDHGISLMLTHSAAQKIIVKLPYHYQMLKHAVPASNLIYIPFFMKDTKTSPYRPLSSGTLTSMTACARSYKVAAYVYPYASVIAKALQKTGGRHVHVGPLTGEQRQRIATELHKHKISPERFIHIPWADDLTKLAREYNVDVYVQSFPIGSGRTSIEMMRAAIPIINHRHHSEPMFNGADYCHPQSPEWSTPAELIQILHGLDRKRLLQLSRDARTFFENNNAFDKTADRIRNLQGLNPPVRDHYKAIILRDIAQDFPDAFDLKHAVRQGLKGILKKMGLLKPIQAIRTRL